MGIDGHWRQAVAALASTALMAACTVAGPTPPPTPLLAPTATASATIAPTPGQEILRKEAAGAYLAMAQASFDQQSALVKQYEKPSATLATLKTYCSKMADVYRASAELLNRIRMPDDTREPAERMLAALTAADAHLRQCAADTTKAAWDRDWNEAFKDRDEASEAGSLIRIKLGLPPIPA